MNEFPAWFRERLLAIQGKRPRTVVEHILKHGHITTEELQNLYGYEHPPRAARDVRELGIPLETFKTKNSQGRTIAAYRFADPAQLRSLTGRKPVSKEFKQTLIEGNGSCCTICLEKYDGRSLQVDHRVPYEVAGETRASESPVAEHMLLCGSCNRAKSWSCEHCVNWLEAKAPNVCEACYWAHPESYQHIALRDIRRVDVLWSGKGEVAEYERLRQRAEHVDTPLPKYVKRVLRKSLRYKGGEVRHGPG